MEGNTKTNYKIRVFTTPVCPYCFTLKEFLKDNNIEFEEVDVANDEKARQEMIDKSGQMSAPVVEIDGQIIVGFDREKIIETLRIEE